jgi:hypothetical protein
MDTPVRRWSLATDKTLARALRDPLLRLAAHYLLNARRDGKPVDPWPASIWAMAPGWRG